MMVLLNPQAVFSDSSISGGTYMNWVVATQIFLEFSSLFGEIIQFDEHIFEMGWFNHQLDEPRKQC